MRVHIDGLLPLITNSILEFSNGDEVKTNLVYERLDKHCTKCLRLDHDLKECLVARAEAKALKAVQEEGREESDTNLNLSGFTRGFSTAPQHANRNLRAPELINQQAFQFSASHKGSGREKKIETDARNHLQNRGYKTQNQSWQERGSQRRSYQARERSKFDSDRYSRPSREHHSQRSLPGPPSKSYYREVQKIAHDPRDTGFSASKSIHANVERGNPQHASQGMIPQSVLNEARGEARDVLLQYTKCADPTEMEVREERVRQAEERGQVEANARKIARASLNSSEEQWMSPAKSSSERVPASQRLGPNEQAKEPNVGLVVSEGADNSRRRTPISQWLGDVATSPIKSPRVPAVLRLGTGHSGSPSKLPEDKIPLKRKPGRPPGRVRIPASPTIERGSPAKRRVLSTKPTKCRQKLNSEPMKGGTKAKKGK
ncbi:unnamed protein product, partial [Brassica oleracea]